LRLGRAPVSVRSTSPFCSTSSVGMVSTS
jgi:hypothetical protein